MHNRKKEIQNALSQNPVDTGRLFEISRMDGGFVTNALRSRVWPKLLGINRYVLSDYRKFLSVHRDDRQIGCDVDRSFWTLDVAKNWGERRLNRKRAALSDIITAVLCKHSKYYYFQGFHDIVSVLMLVFNDNALAYATTEVLCDKYLFDFMRKDFSSLSKTMKLILVLVRCADAPLADFLDECGTEPYFATSWLITWFSHDIRNLQQAARVFDVLICSPPEYCFYLCAALVLHYRDDILHLEADFSTVHDFLTRILRRHEDQPTSTDKCTVDLERVIARADLLLARYPPSQAIRFADAAVRHSLEESRLVLFNQSDTPKELELFCPDFLMLTTIRLRNFLVDCSLLPPSPRGVLISAARGWATISSRRPTGKSFRQSSPAGKSSVLSWRHAWSTMMAKFGNRKKDKREMNYSAQCDLLLVAAAGGFLSMGVWIYSGGWYSGPTTS